MANKPTSKRPSVAGHKVKVSNEPAVAAPASPGEVGGAAGFSSDKEGAEGKAVASAKRGQVPAAGTVARQPGSGGPAAASQLQHSQPQGASSAPGAAAGAAGARVPAKPSVPASRIAEVGEVSRIQQSEVSAKTGTPRMAKRPTKRRVPRKAFIAVASLLVALAVATAVLSWNQWFRYDDASDIQGTWKAESGNVTLVITDSDIEFTEDVSYPYTLDTFAKTISFNFGNYSGGGSYAFSPERDALTITEENPDAEGGKSSTTLVKQ